MTSIRYRVLLTPTARSMLAAVKDRRTLEQIRDRIDGLSEDPEVQGKPLLGELKGYRSLRAAGQRYRIIYTVQEKRVVVFVVAVGIRHEGSRRDIYALAKKLIRLRLLE